MAIPKRSYLRKCICRHWSFETYPPRPGASPNLAANVDEALVLPYLNYCSEVWGCICKVQCDRLHRLQNRAGRRPFVILTQDLLIYFTTYGGTTLSKGDARSSSQISVFNSE